MHEINWTASIISFELFYTEMMRFQLVYLILSFSLEVASVFLNMAEERTFIMVKPDGVQRGLVGTIIKRFEQRGFELVAMKFMQVIN